MSESDRERWDAKYRESGSRSPAPAADWLAANFSKLPRGGRALDLAAGDGGNALLLASRGWKVTAVDIAAEGLAIGRRVSGALRIEWVVADLDDYEPPRLAFDLITCFRFLDRERLPRLVREALKPGGYFLAETYNQREAQRPDGHSRNPNYLLEDGEWRRLFADFEIVAEDEEGATSRVLARRPLADGESPE